MIDLSWVDEFWKQTSRFMHYREEDDILILPPNRVFKLNETGRRLIQWLFSGRRVVDIRGLSEEQKGDIGWFFKQLVVALRGEEPVVRQIPYDFDYTKLPILGEIAVTYRCNNRCLFCYAGCESGCKVMSSGEMSTSEVKRIIDIFKDEAKIPFFSFTGGEPLMRDDLEELIGYAVGRGLKVNLISNGRLASVERARRLFESGLVSAQVSIESSEAEVHDRLCGAKGAFLSSCRGIEALVGAGISVQTNTTCLRGNLETLRCIPKVVRALGVERMSYNLFIPTSRSPQNDALFLSYEEVCGLIDGLREAVESEEMEFLWYSPVPLCLYNPLQKGLGNKNCAACDGLLSVDPQGNVLPCSSWDERVGNLLEEDFKGVWFGERAKFIKGKCFASEECRGCDHFVACQGACPLYWEYVKSRGLDVFYPCKIIGESSK